MKHVKSERLKLNSRRKHCQLWTKAVVHAGQMAFMCQANVILASLGHRHLSWCESCSTKDDDCQRSSVAMLCWPWKTTSQRHNPYKRLGEAQHTTQLAPGNGQGEPGGALTLPMRRIVRLTSLSSNVQGPGETGETATYPSMVHMPSLYKIG